MRDRVWRWLLTDLPAVAGQIVAALPPADRERLRAALWPEERPADADRLAALEARVDALEQVVAALALLDTQRGGADAPHS